MIKRQEALEVLRLLIESPVIDDDVQAALIEIYDCIAAEEQCLHIWGAPIKEALENDKEFDIEQYVFAPADYENKELMENVGIDGSESVEQGMQKVPEHKVN